MGDRNLGGRDFDMVLFEYFAKEFKNKYMIDIKNSDKAAFRLMSAVEKLKKSIVS